MRTLKIGSDFSGVGAFDYAIGRVANNKGFEVETVYACDWDKYARITYAHNHGTPPYYPKDVYEREIPKESLDMYMTSPPCQAFSLAGKRLGKEDKRGILFFNSHEFIKENKPRFFIFENVKGLLSDDGGKTFSEWVNMLGGKSVNGLPVLFPYDDSVPYHIYWKVLNSKDHGVPQNRERVFIVGIREDKDNNFQFPKEEYLVKKLKDVLEESFNEKYLLSQSAIKSVIMNDENIQKAKINPEIAAAIQCPGNSSGTYKGMNAILGSEKEGKKFGKENKSESNFSFGCHKLNDTLDKNILKIEIGKAIALDVHNRSVHDHCPALTEPHHNSTRLFDGFYIRKLTPRECFRLQDFPDTFDFSVVSDTQAYKQAGNSITVRVLEKILNNLSL